MISQPILADTAPAVLIIDDHPSIGRLLAANLRRTNPAVGEIAQVFNIEEAENACALGEPDIVLLDRLIPPYSSYEETLPLLRQFYKGPIVALSGHFSEGDAVSHPNDIHAFVNKDDLLSETLGDFLLSLKDKRVQNA